MSLDCRVGERLPELTLPGVDAATVAAYAAASGDTNPLHILPELAARLGAASPPLPGLLILSQVPRLLQLWRCPHRLVHLEALFLRPVPTEMPILLAGRVVQIEAAGMSAVLRLTARSDGRLAVTVEARIRAVLDTDD